MNQAEIQTLLRKFAAPLAGYAATSPARKEGAEFLARNLWMAMIAGPEMEVETWKVFKTTGQLDDDSLQAIKDVYFEQMKPVVSEEQLGALRRPLPEISFEEWLHLGIRFTDLLLVRLDKLLKDIVLFGELLQP